MSVLKERRLAAWMDAAAAGACFVAITQLATKSELSPNERYAVLRLATALPLLVAAAIANSEFFEAPRLWWFLLGPVIGSLGNVFFIWGLFDLMLNFGSGTTFAFSTSAALVIILNFFARRSSR